MRTALLQTDIVWEDPAANFERLRPRLREAAAAGARLLVLPEMFACGFSMDTGKVAEAPDGPSTRFLREEARTLDAWIAGSIPVRPAGGDRPFNTLTVAGPDGTCHRYRKIHPFTHAGERDHYAAGDELVTVSIEGVRTTLFVCYDLRFADEFWQRAPDTDLYLVVANWPEPRRAHWRVLLRARAIENQAYVFGVNRVGRGGADGSVAYAGDSAAVDPWGEVLAEASRDPATLLVDVDAERVSRARRVFPVLPDRRT
jgi:predicted amidohydrolase